MNLNASIKYQVNENKSSIIIYYIVILAVILLSMTGHIFFPNVIVISGNTNGFELSTMIFLFIAGMNSFRETFCMLVQNSISRKTIFITRLISTGIIGAGMALADRLLVSIGKLLQPDNPSFAITSLHEALYQRNAGGFGNAVEGLLFATVSYITVWLLGYFITVGYYRMSKGGKITVSIAVPVSLFVVLPILDDTVFQGGIGRFLGRLASFLFGFSGATPNPYAGMLSLLLISAAFSGFAWLMIRKAVVKN
jgi:hypothetical protein